MASSEFVRGLLGALRQTVAWSWARRSLLWWRVSAEASMAVAAHLLRILPVTLAVVAALSWHVAAQQPVPPVQPTPPTSELADRCPGLVANNTPRVIPAALRTALAGDQVRITY